MTGYTRQSSYTNGDTILSAHSNDEYDQLVSAFDAAIGHKHDGTAAEGGSIPLLSDSDGDTKIEIERTADDDTIYLKTASVDRMSISSTGVITLIGDTTISGGGTFNSVPDFNGGTSGVDAPFTVDSTFLVTNLNADLLDGVEGSGYLLVGAKAADSELLDGVDSDNFARSDVDDTINGVYTHTAVILNTNGTSADPAYSFSSDPNTGIYTDSADTIVFSAGGVERSRLTTAAFQTQVAIRSTSGSSAVPTISFTDDANTGVYNPAADTVGFSVNGGSAVATLDTTSFDTSVPIRSHAGTAAEPGVSFFIDPDTGMYRDGVNVLGFSTGGVKRVDIDSTSFDTTVPIRSSNGSAASPAYSFSSDTNTGMYSSAADIIGFSAAGTKAVEITTNSLEVSGTAPYFYINETDATADNGLWAIQASGDTLLFRVSDDAKFSESNWLQVNRTETTVDSIDFGGTARFITGSAATPSVAFAFDPDTGMYWVTNNRLGITTGGVNRLSVDTFEILTTVPLFTPAGTAADPSYSFSTDRDTGIYSEAADILGFSTGGVKVANINSNGITTVSGDSNFPSFSFIDDPNTGIYTDSADTIVFSAGGVERARLTTGAFQTQLPILATDGSAATPSHSFSADSDTGMYRAAINGIGFSAGGVERARLTTDAFQTQLPIISVFGSAASPTYTFSSDPNTGMYNLGGDALGFSTGGVKRLEISTDNGLFSTLNVLAPQGTAALPAYSFSVANNTGMYAVAANVLGFSTGGINPLQIASAGITVTSVESSSARIISDETDYVSGTTIHVEFKEAGVVRGSITSDGSNTAYNTSSDYRLKENVKRITGSIDLVKELKPYHFNFIGQEDVVCGFIAHEVQEVVPEAVTGEKDGEEMQQMDASKLVPILTAALIECIARIEVLEGGR